jgi:hypothetical protein
MNISILFGNKPKIIYELFYLYTQALAKYLDVESSLNLDEIIDKAKRKNNDDLNLFIDWFERKGRKTILDISKIEIPENEDFMAQIEYEIYILRENLESEDLEDLRALLINIIVDLPFRIK